MNCTVEKKRLHGSKLFVPPVNICGAQGRLILVPRFCPNLVMKSYEYYPSLCGDCHQGPGSPSSPLLRCSKCKICCCRNYQSKDWKKDHKGTLFSHCQPFISSVEVSLHLPASLLQSWLLFSRTWRPPSDLREMSECLLVL